MTRNFFAVDREQAFHNITQQPLQGAGVRPTNQYARTRARCSLKARFDRGRSGGSSLLAAQTGTEAGSAIGRRTQSCRPPRLRSEVGRPYPDAGFVGALGLESEVGYLNTRHADYRVALGSRLYRWRLARSVASAQTGRSGGLDRQQALLLEMLGRAAGAPVSYAQLREAGIEFPASVASELELAGVAIERPHANARGLVGVRLDPSSDPYRKPVLARRLQPISKPAAHRERASVHIHRVSAGARLWRSLAAALVGTASAARRGLMALSRTASSLRERPGEARVGGERRSIRRGSAVARRVRSDATRLVRELDATAAKRWLAVLGLLAATGLVVAVALAHMWGGGRVRHIAVHTRPPKRAAIVVQRSRGQAVSSEAHTTPTRAQQVSHPALTPVSPALAAQLDTQGHELLGAGRYGDAITVLERTLAATGERLQDCLEPTSETCLTYAYALYDLGRALRFDGQPAAAVPVLRRRLLIDNQRPTVRAQLELAIAQTS
jgi:hypothetical protein